MERFKLIPAVYALIWRENEILLSLRQNTGFADGLYGLVSGHLDGGESATEGLRREIREESGIDVLAENLAIKLVMHRLSTDCEAVDFSLKRAYCPTPSITPSPINVAIWLSFR